MASIVSLTRASVHGAVARSAAVAAPKPLLRSRSVCKASWQESLAAVGDVDAPIGVIFAGAVVVTLVATAVVPLALNPGQKAANQIFDSKQKPRQKVSVKKPTQKGPSKAGRPGGGR